MEYFRSHFQHSVTIWDLSGETTRTSPCLRSQIFASSEFSLQLWLTQQPLWRRIGPFCGNVAAHRHCHIASLATGRVRWAFLKLEVSQTLIEAVDGWLTAFLRGKQHMKLRCDVSLRQACVNRSINNC
jgi:hypothetical protein